MGKGGSLRLPPYAKLVFLGCEIKGSLRSWPAPVRCSNSYLVLRFAAALVMPLTWIVDLKPHRSLSESFFNAYKGCVALVILSGFYGCFWSFLNKEEFNSGIKNLKRGENTALKRTSTQLNATLKHSLSAVRAQFYRCNSAVARSFAPVFWNWHLMRLETAIEQRFSCVWKGGQDRWSRPIMALNFTWLIRSSSTSRGAR